MTIVADATTAVAWTIIQGTWLATLLALVYLVAVARSEQSPEWRARCAMITLVGLSVVTAGSALVTCRSLARTSPVDGVSAGSGSSFERSDGDVAQTASPREQVRTVAAARQASDFARLLLSRYMSESPALATLWIGCVAILLLRLGISARRIAVLRRRVCSDPVIDYSPVAEVLGISPPPIVRVTPHVAMPCVIGWRNAIVLIPEWVHQRVTDDERRMIVAHELAHVKRNDYPGNFILRIIEAIHFYNPAVWWLARRLRHEREVACDLAAIRATHTSPVRYSRILLAIEMRRSSGLVPGMPFSDGNLLPRVKALLKSRLASKDRPHRSPLRLAAVASLAVMFIALSLRAASAATAYAATEITGNENAVERIRVGISGVTVSNPTLAAPRPYEASLCGRDAGAVEDRRDVLADGRGTWLVAWRGAQCDVRLEIVGDVEVDMLRGAIVRRGAGASFHASVTHSNGKAELTVNDVFPRISSPQRELLRRLLDDVDRHTGVNAPVVVPQLLSGGSIVQAIHHAGTLATPYARSSYLAQIIECSDGHAGTMEFLRSAVDSLRVSLAQRAVLLGAVEQRSRR